MELERDPAKYNLKPCPFCGASAHLGFDESWTDHQEVCYISCSRGCLEEDQHFNAPGPPQTPLVKTIAEAAKIWNRRAEAAICAPAFPLPASP